MPVTGSYFRPSADPATVSVFSILPDILYSTIVLEPEPPVDTAPLPYSAHSEPLAIVSESRPEVPAVPVANTELLSIVAMLMFLLSCVQDARVARRPEVTNCASEMLRTRLKIPRHEIIFKL